MSYRGMSYRGTLNKVHAVYRAWNERRWDDYAEAFAPDLVAYASGEGTPLDKHEHVARQTHFCALCPDSHVHGAPHLILFGNPDGTRICAVSRLTGTLPDLRSPGRAFDVTLAVIYLWRDGRIVEHRQFVNSNGQPLSMHDLRGTLHPGLED